MTAKRWSWLMAAVLMVGLSGCYGGYRGRVYSTTSATVVAQPGLVYQAPPPPRSVYVQPAPYPGAVWVEGHWEWNGVQYVWVDGFWTEPRPGYVYVQPRWERRGGGYVYIDGGWAPAGGGAVVVQPRPTRGTVVVGPSQGGAVVVQPRTGPAPDRVVVSPSPPHSGGSVVVSPQPGRVVVSPSQPAAPSGRVVVSPSQPSQPSSGRVVVTPRGGPGGGVSGGGRVVVRP
jgi:hypothetical protein